MHRHENTYDYEDAETRIAGEPTLIRHAETILYEWPEGPEHWEWVCTAPVSEILDWAEVVQREAE